MSKRNIKRQIKNQVSLYMRRAEDSKENEIQAGSESSENEHSKKTEDFQDFPEVLEESSAPLKVSLCDKLRKWYMQTKPSRKCVESLG